MYQDLKKCLAKLALIVESFLRHEDIFKQKGNPNNEKHLKSYQENILKEETALKEVQQELATYLPCLDGIDIEGR